MSNEFRIGWLTIIALVALSLAMILTAKLAHADAPSLADRIAAIVPHYGSKSVELVDPQEFATAVDTACKHDRECAARLVTMAIAESNLSAAVSRSEYSEHQGDAHVNRDGVRVHLAAGLWQLHKSRLNADTWDSPDLLVQARNARAMQLGALAECRAFKSVQPEVGMWRVLSGRGCTAAYSGEKKRQELLARIRGRL